MTGDREITMTHVKSDSLAARTILALVLMIGFYFLALAIAALLIFVIYLEIINGRLNIYVTLVCLFAAGVILWSIIPRPERFQAPGPALTAEKYPLLFTELKSISQAVNQKMPSEVYLLPEPNAFVSQAGGFLGLGSRRVMGIGLPLFGTLTVSQLRSVLAHEFGHYCGGDTKLGPWVYRTRSMVIRTVNNLRTNNTLMYLIRLPFYGYGKLFLRITLSVSRRQEYNADKLAAQVAGSNNAIQALQTIHGIAPAWEAYWSSEYLPVFGTGFVPPLADGFSSFLKAKTIAQKVSDIVTKDMKNTRTGAYDSHPSTKDRIEALEAFPAEKDDTGNSPASSLIGDVPQLEIAILRPIAEKHHLPPLKNVTWDEIARLVYIPAWQKAVQQQEALVKGLTPEMLPEVAKNIEVFENRLFGVDEMNSEQRLNLLYRTIGAALTLSLWQRGWQVITAPGEPILACKANQKLDCFVILPGLQDSTLPADAWVNNCRNLGITGVDLSRVTGDPLDSEGPPQTSEG
jgi:heat shock protein HtpX